MRTFDIFALVSVSVSVCHIHRARRDASDPERIHRHLIHLHRSVCVFGGLQGGQVGLVLFHSLRPTKLLLLPSVIVTSKDICRSTHDPITHPRTHTPVERACHPTRVSDWGIPLFSTARSYKLYRLLACGCARIYHRRACTQSILWRVRI